MNIWWWILYIGSFVVFGFDLVLELSKKRTITDYVREGTPNWIWYAGGLAAFNAVFWLWSPAVGMLFLGAWLMGHFTE